MAKTIAENLVEEWDTNNAICLLGDHRDDLVNNIESALLTVAREAEAKGAREQRERDAKIADTYFDDDDNCQVDADAMFKVGKWIAKLIRTQETSK